MVVSTCSNRRARHRRRQVRTDGVDVGLVDAPADGLEAAIATCTHTLIESDAMLIATDYKILRRLKADGKIRVPLGREPKRLATIIDEGAFLANGALIHNRTVFLEDRNRGWVWRAGYLTYFTRVAAMADVVVVFEEARCE